MTELEYLSNKIKQIEDNRKDSLVRGCAVADHLEYVRLVGVLAGLALAQGEIRDLIKNQHKLEELDE